MTYQEQINIKQIEIDLLHKQLDAKQLELENKYTERNKICSKLKKAIKNGLKETTWEKS